MPLLCLAPCVSERSRTCACGTNFIYNQDGTKLSEFIEFCRTVAKGFKKVDANLIDAGTMKEAKVLDKKIRAARSELRKKILSIFLPILPTYIAAVLLQVGIRTIQGFVWGYKAQIEAAAAVENPDRDACFSMMFVWFVLINVLNPFEKLGHMLLSKASKMFELQLRKVVLKCLLSQDRVYFDRHNTQDLHNKLDRWVWPQPDSCGSTYDICLCPVRAGTSESWQKTSCICRPTSSQP